MRSSLFISLSLACLTSWWQGARVNAAEAPRASQNSGATDSDTRQDSDDFLARRQQYQLQHLGTEQRHPATWEFTQHAEANTQAGLQELWRVDADIVAMLKSLAANPVVLKQMSHAMQQAWGSGHRVIFFGCGSTGRLAKTLEALWRTAFAKLDQVGVPAALAEKLPHLRHSVFGDITGGDRALISSLEGFEDLPLVGALQMAAAHVGQGDVVVAISEGGETPAVLGAISAAVRTQGVRPQDAYFVFNNKAADLQSLERCRDVLEDPAITPLELATGPQAISGSTRMQATTSSMFVLGVVLEDALIKTLEAHLPPAQVQALGLTPRRGWADRLGDFAKILDSVKAQAPALAVLTDSETQAYQQGARSIYSARGALPTLFTDATERSPTFRLAPFDPVDAEPRQAWLHVCTDAASPEGAWHALLGRNFRGLDTGHFRTQIAAEVADSDLQQAAERSLSSAGPDQGQRYDLSASSLSRPQWRPGADDFLLEVLLGGEAPLNILHPAPGGHALHRLCISAGTSNHAACQHAAAVDVPADLLNLRQHIAAKLLLNAHSTVIMAKMGRLVGNTMAYVQPSNLKLIGRATYLIQSHINDVRKNHNQAELTYAEANRLLFEAIAYRAKHDPDHCPPEVYLAVVYAVLQHEESSASWEGARIAAQNTSFEQFKKLHAAND